MGSGSRMGSARSGSDWVTWRVREVATGQDLPEVIEWSKFSGAAWRKDGSGFYYMRYDAPEPGQDYAGTDYRADAAAASR